MLQIYLLLISTRQRHNVLKCQTENLESKVRDHELKVILRTKCVGVQIDHSLN